MPSEVSIAFRLSIGISRKRLRGWWSPSLRCLNRLSAVYRNLTHNATPEQAAQGVVEVSIAFRLSIGISLELYCRIGKGGVMSVSIAFRLSIGISPVCGLGLLLRPDSRESQSPFGCL